MNPFRMARIERYASRIRKMAEKGGITLPQKKSYPDYVEVFDAGNWNSIRKEYQQEMVKNADSLLAWALSKSNHMKNEQGDNITPYDVQIYAARKLLEGNVAIDMKTGEGKTYAIALAAAARAALSRVVVATADRYLAKRDANMLADYYRSLGLRVGRIEFSDMIIKSYEVTESGEREIDVRELRNLDVIYTTPSDLMFSYILAGHRLLGSFSLIADEIDQLMISPTPFIHTMREEDYEETAEDRMFVELAKLIDEEWQKARGEFERMEWTRPPFMDRLRGEDYYKEYEGKYVRFKIMKNGGISYELTDKFYEKADEIAGKYGIKLGLKDRQEPEINEETERDLEFYNIINSIIQSLKFEEGKHYYVHNGEITILNIETGRKEPGKTFIIQEGLEYLLRARGINVKYTRTYGASTGNLTFPSFATTIPLSVAGISGSVLPSKNFFRDYLAMHVEEMPRNVEYLINRKKLKRVGDHWTDGKRDYWLPESHGIVVESNGIEYLLSKSHEMIKNGRSVIISVNSISEAKEIAEAMERSGRFGNASIHVLTAENEEEDAKIYAEAGKPNTITIIAKMAGRGVNFPLSKEVKEKGGIHFIIYQPPAGYAAYVQLKGRVGRNGNPGSYEMVIDRNSISQEETHLREILSKIPDGKYEEHGVVGDSIMKVLDIKDSLAQANAKHVDMKGRFYLYFNTMVERDVEMLANSIKEELSGKYADLPFLVPNLTWKMIQEFANTNFQKYVGNAEAMFIARMVNAQQDYKYLMDTYEAFKQQFEIDKMKEAIRSGNKQALKETRIYKFMEKIADEVRKAVKEIQHQENGNRTEDKLPEDMQQNPENYMVQRPLHEEPEEDSEGELEGFYEEQRPLRPVKDDVRIHLARNPIVARQDMVARAGNVEARISNYFPVWNPLLPSVVRLETRIK